MSEPVLVLADDAQAYRDALIAQIGPERDVLVATAADALPPGADAIRVVLAKPALLAAALPTLPGLRWAQSTFAGVDALLSGRWPSTIELTGLKGIFGPLMAEYVMGQVIAVSRDFRRLQQAQRARRWEPFAYRGLAGRTLGVVGLGSIGQRVAAAAAHFGMHVSGLKRTSGAVPGVDRVVCGGDVAAFAADQEFLVLVLPATPQTRHLIDARVLAAMSPTAWLINVGRGSAVDEPALVEALAAGRLGGAVLDVFADEPLPADSPLWALPNAVITPHVSAESFPDQIVGVFVENLRRFERGEPLLHRIDPERGY
jgi:phosphoglycerate dehydrogenase-like enzyme